MNTENIDLHAVGYAAFIAMCERAGNISYHDEGFIRRIDNARKHATFDAENQLILIGDSYRVGNTIDVTATVHVAYKLNPNSSDSDDYLIRLVINNGNGHIVELCFTGLTYLNLIQGINAMHEQAKTIANLTRRFSEFFKAQF